MRSRAAGGAWFIAIAMTACGDDTSSTNTGAGGNGGDSGAGGATASGTGGATGATGGAGGAGECLPFGTACEATDACCDALGVAGECYAFGNGPACSIPCPADPADCPNGGEGCNNMSPAYCKAPA